MEKTSEFLIYLMACSLQGTKPEEALLANIDMEALLRLAKAHSVSAMVCMALEQTDAFQHAAETTRLKWLDCKNKAVRKNMLLDAERHRLEKEFAEHGIWYMPLKGSILKDWYPKFGMREMADNDILFDASKRKEVKAIFQGRGYTVKEYDKSNHDAYEKPPIYNFEMHVSLFPGTYKERTEQYENAKERLLPVDGTAYQFAFTPEDFYVFVLAHAYKHYSHLTVYQSGYVLFSAGKRNTVFHIHDCCGDYAYDAAAGRGDVIKEEYFENCEWHIRALFEGERKMEESQWKCEGAGQGNVCVSYHAVAEDWGEIADRTINVLEKIVEKEALHAMMEVLTKKQRRLIHQQFVLGKTHQEIADDMGISRGSVTRAVNQALERIRRKFDFETHYGSLLAYRTSRLLTAKI